MDLNFMIGIGIALIPAVYFLWKLDNKVDRVLTKLGNGISESLKDIEKDGKVNSDRQRQDLQAIRDDHQGQNEKLTMMEGRIVGLEKSIDRIEHKLDLHISKDNKQ